MPQQGMTEGEPQDGQRTSAAPAAPARQAALGRLLAAHEGYFDVQRDHAFAGRVFPGYAEFHSEASQYVLAKRAKLWEANAHEYLFFLLADRLDAARYADAVAFMTGDALAKVDLVPNHMTSYLSLVVIADAVDEDVRRAVRRERFHKDFRWGLRGWADLRVAVVDLSDSSITTNAMGKDLRATLEANAFDRA